MPYEVQAMPESITVNPQAPQQSAPIRERVFEPYKVSGPKPKASPIGQTDMRGESAPEEPGKTEETVKLSPQVAALARKEQRFRQQQQELQQERTQIAAEKAELEQLRQMKQKLAEKDYSALDDLVNYDDYSQYKVNQINGRDPVQEEIKKLEGKISSLEKQSEDHITKQFEAAVAERRTAAQELVDQTDRFPRIKKAKASEAVVKHILDTWEHDSQELTVEQAAKEVEEILLERAKLWAGLLEEEKKPEPPAEKKQLPPLKPSLKTLTNQVTAGELKTPSRPLHLLSDSERWAEARRRVEARLQAQAVKGA